MPDRRPARRLRRLPLATVLGCEVPVASRFGARFLGLAHLDRDEAGVGLLIPRCSSVHTFGMRFPLDLFFFAEDGTLVAIRRGALPGRFACRRGASAVLEIPTRKGGEFSSPEP